MGRSVFICRIAPWTVLFLNPARPKGRGQEEHTGQTV